jgi:peptidoglycan/LPS O-acetylase OafA/YrhL
MKIPSPSDSSIGIQTFAGRLYEIDMLRFIAALAVMLHHYTFRGFAADHLTVLSYPEMVPFSKYGYLGVDLFFMISGFVILMASLNHNWRHFIISRIVRLYPAFWFCCSVTFLCRLFLGDDKYSPSLVQYFVNLTMLQPLFGIDSIDGVYWTLFVEIRFYFFVFLILLLRQTHRLKHFLAAWLFFSIVLTIWHSRYVGAVLITSHAPYFIAGALFYLIYSEGTSICKSVLIIASLIVILFQSHQTLIEMQQHFQTSFNSWIVTAILTTYFIAFFLISTNRLRFVSSSKYLIFGAITYPLYLIHQRVGYIIFNVSLPYINRHVLLWGTVLIMLCAAYFIHSKIERVVSRPFRRQLERLFALPKERSAHES